MRAWAGTTLLTPTRGVCVCVCVCVCESAGGASVAGSGDPAWRSHGFDFVHVLIVADVGVSLWG